AAITSSGLTQSTARLLGRSAAGTGAIQEITLGTNLSFSGTTLNAAGGGSTSPLTTKGDVWGFSTVDARIPIGSDNQVLTADSTQALGLKWATPSSGFPDPLTTKGELIVLETDMPQKGVGTNGTFL